MNFSGNNRSCLSISFNKNWTISIYFSQSMQTRGQCIFLYEGQMVINSNPRCFLMKLTTSSLEMVCIAYCVCVMNFKQRPCLGREIFIQLCKEQFKQRRIKRNRAMNKKHKIHDLWNLFWPIIFMTSNITEVVFSNEKAYFCGWTLWEILTEFCPA